MKGYRKFHTKLTKIIANNNCKQPKTVKIINIINKTYNNSNNGQYTNKIIGNIGIGNNTTTIIGRNYKT